MVKVDNYSNETIYIMRTPSFEYIIIVVIKMAICHTKGNEIVTRRIPLGISFNFNTHVMKFSQGTNTSSEIEFN